MDLERDRIMDSIKHLPIDVNRGGIRFGDQTRERDTRPQWKKTPVLMSIAPSELEILDEIDIAGDAYVVNYHWPVTVGHAANLSLVGNDYYRIQITFTRQRRIQVVRYA